jgi:ABC-type multidrug transport system ATPase subunit
MIMSDNHTENLIRVNDPLASGAKVDVVDFIKWENETFVKECSFNLDSGNLSALMGPSGA